MQYVKRFISLWVKLISSDKGSTDKDDARFASIILQPAEPKNISWIYLSWKWKRCYLLQTLITKIKRYFGFVSVCGELQSKKMKPAPLFYLHWVRRIFIKLHNECFGLSEYHQATFGFM